MDPPEMILNGALEGHYKMIKQMKGVPGVLPERYAEGFKVISSWAWYVVFELDLLNSILRSFETFKLKSWIDCN